MTQSTRPRLAYLLKTFPRLSETFILQEILALERLGLDLEIFTLRRPTEDTVHALVKDVRARVRFVPALGPRSQARDAVQVIWSHAWLLATRRQAYLRALRFFRERRQGGAVKTFVQAGYLAYALLRSEHTHLHAHFANLPASVAELVSLMTGIPFSFTAHAKDIYLTPPEELRRKMGSATAVLTCTGYNLEYLRGLDSGQPAVHLAYHGVDVERFAEAGRNRRESQGPPLILAIGRFCEKKGFYYLVEALGLLLGRGIDFRCEIVGYGELENALRDQIARLGLEGRVKLTGRLTQDQVIERYSRAALFALPCLVTDDGDRDGIPNVLLEAMAAGLPVVSTAVSGITELVEHGVNGLLAASRDAESLAGAVDRLVQSPTLRRQLGEAGRLTVARSFALDAAARHVYELLLEASGQRPVPLKAAETALAGVGACS